MTPEIITKSMFLEKIIEYKKSEVAEREQRTPLSVVQKKIETAPLVRDFAGALMHQNRLGLIAEVKKQSPVKGLLVPDFDHMRLATTYVEAGADAISVLTDTHFWGGSHDFLRDIREKYPENPPLLCKDVIISEYQVYEARAYGADAILLIVMALSESELRSLYTLAHSLGMEVLVEVHNEAELEVALRLQPRVLGINNRNLDTFVIDIHTTERLIGLLGDQQPVIVSESGIKDEVQLLHEWGVQAVLVGESIVTASNPEEKIKRLIADVL